MNNLTLHTVKEEKVFKFKIARIYTMTYNKKLKKNEIHTPNAAKIIFEDNDTINCIIVLQPLIVVDDKNNIKVDTSSTFEEATLKTSYSKLSSDEKTLKTEIKLLEAKHKLGITIEELIELGLTKSKLEAILLEKRKENIYKGGGF